MNDICQRTYKDHRLDFVECKNGEERWLCLDCGETITQYQDSFGG